MSSSSGRPRVVYWNNIPAPYMVDRFNAIARRGNLEFEAWFSDRTEAGRSWQVDESTWSFGYRYLPRAGLGAYALPIPVPLFRRRTIDLLVSLYAGVSYVLSFVVARQMGIATAFWVEKTFDSWVRRASWKESLKRRLLPAADGILTVGTDGRRFAELYGVRPDNIYLARHSVDIEHFAAGSRGLYPERERTRSSLGLTGVVFLYVGRLWQGKGLDSLLEAFSLLQSSWGDGVSLLLVGDGADEQRYRSEARRLRLRNLVFAGFIPQRELPKFYAASDVFVLPTYGDPYALVIDEAMASGLPIIATSAIGELTDRVIPGVNGFVVPTVDHLALSRSMASLASDPAARTRFGQESQRLIQGHTPDRWAADFECAAHQILKVRT